MQPTTLLFLVLGMLARELIVEASKDHLKDKLKSFFGWLEALGERDKVELAYQDAMEQAYAACLEMLLLNIKSSGYNDQELKEYGNSLKAFIKDKTVAAQLLEAVREPSRSDLPSPDVLRERWAAVGGLELPTETIWNAVASAFRRQVTKRIILSAELRDLLNAQNLQELKELIERQGGVKTQVRRDKYSQRMRTRFAPVDLANLMPAYADDPGRMVIRDVFVAQHVRENPPPIEIPKDLVDRIRKGGQGESDDHSDEVLNTQQRERLHTTYVSQSPRPVLEVIATPGNRLLVLTGDPGSGKSTLMRYLLTSIIEPPIDHQSGEPLPWTLAFKDAFPLLIELRDFYALRQSDECDSFLEYVAYMGKTDQWFLDDHTVHDYLEQGPALVMFDGLDEIFDNGDRERVMHEIAGFAQRYPRTRIIVTSRPVGYKEQVLRNAGFAHFGLQDLDDEQIETFIRGWFALTFPQQPQQAEQRIERVLGSVQQSKSIRLLAGNPMLLTIMALLAREDELPRERAKFYEKAVEVLCHHWDANRNLHLTGDNYLNADDKKDLLRRIAMRMQVGEGGLKANIVAEDDLEHEIQAFLIDEQWQPNAAEAKRAARRMIQQLRERNYILCLRGPHLYGFVHRTFLEYLTAADFVHRFHVVKTLDIDDLIALFDDHCRDDEWREVLRLICGQIDEQFVGRIVEHLATRTDLDHWTGLFKQEPLPEIPLAIYCLGECRGSAKMEAAGQIILETVIRLLSQAGEETRIQTSVLEFLEIDLMQASQEIGSRWPKKKQLRNIALAQLSSMHHWGLNLWPLFIASVEPVQEILTAMVTQDKHTGTRGPALQILAQNWPDDQTRVLLEQCANEDVDSILRSTALEALTQNWPDQQTRALLADRALQDESEHPRGTALQALVQTWPDDQTRALLTDRATHDVHGDIREAALQALVQTWPDDQTRALLTDHALQDADAAPRRVALQALANTWPDDATRALLTHHATHDVHEDIREAALQALVQTWPDDQTRALLTDHALQDADAAPRRVALQALADTWPDDTTRAMIKQRVAIDGFAASRFGGEHSKFGQIVFDKNFYGFGPYLDPTKPISRKHIERAAKRANVPVEKIDEAVQSLSAHLGWDITKGSAG